MVVTFVATEMSKKVATSECLASEFRSTGDDFWWTWGQAFELDEMSYLIVT